MKLYGLRLYAGQLHGLRLFTDQPGQVAGKPTQVRTARARCLVILASWRRLAIGASARHQTFTASARCAHFTASRRGLGLAIAARRSLITAAPDKVARTSPRRRKTTAK